MNETDANFVTVKENRNYKDSVFCDLFYSDQDAPGKLLELYNALFEKDLSDVSVIEQVRLENAIFMNMKNDIAFTVMGKRIVLSEHQSTVNPNMPVRMLMYVGREYEKIVPPDAKYSKRLYRIPEPAFIVFYNGLEPYPMERVLSLSDAYCQEGEPCGQLELKVRVININTGMRHPILKRCDTLLQYSRFIETVRGYGTEPEALARAVKDCISKGILSDYLSRKGSEVVNMLFEEYNYERDVEVKQREAAEEAREEGRKEGREEGRKEGIEEGRKEGETRLITLFNRLVSENLTDDIRRATSDEAFRQELYEKYSI